MGKPSDRGYVLVKSSGAERRGVSCGDHFKIWFIDLLLIHYAHPERREVKRDGLVTVVRPRLLGRTPHDFRRTAARNLIRAGVAQHVVMQLCGWKTDAMFRRYAIVDERDLRDAVAKLAGLDTRGAPSRRPVQSA